jgi:hypothetical protein
LLTVASKVPHPDVVVEGDAVRSDQGTVVRATQVTLGAQTVITQ